VDLVIKRDDNWINLFEIKFHQTPYKIGKQELANLKNKVATFKNDTRTKDLVVISMLTTFGVVENEYYFEIVENDFTMEILFERI
jgi:hypothetical protein